MARKSDIDWQSVDRRLQSGMKAAEIADELGISTSTVSKRKAELGLTSGRPPASAGKKAAKRGKAKAAPSNVDSAIATLTGDRDLMRGRLLQLAHEFAEDAAKLSAQSREYKRLADGMANETADPRQLPLNGVANASLADVPF